jgi:hypothetical protein
MYQKSKEAATVTDESKDENGFSKSPNDGIILKAEDIKIAIIYDNSLQNFKTYYQE